MSPSISALFSSLMSSMNDFISTTNSSRAFCRGNSSYASGKQGSGGRHGAHQGPTYRKGPIGADKGDGVAFQLRELFFVSLSGPRQSVKRCKGKSCADPKEANVLLHCADEIREDAGVHT
jgi:hypothetical protein